MSQTTARGVDYRERLRAGPATVGVATAGFGLSRPAITTHVLSLELDVLREVEEWMDRQWAVWGRFMDVVDEYLKEEGAT